MSKKLVVMVAGEENNYETTKQYVNGNKDAFDGIEEFKKYYQVETSNQKLRNSLKRNGIAYESFIDNGGWEHLVGIAYAEKENALAEIFYSKNN